MSIKLLATTLFVASLGAPSIAASEIEGCIKPPTVEVRGTDAFGSGQYKAPRGHRLHRGVDFISGSGEPFLAPVSGKLLRIGTVYTKSDFTLLEIGLEDGSTLKAFYVEPTIRVGQHFMQDEAIGFVQDLNRRYPGITPHTHMELQKPDGQQVNPILFLCN